MMLMLKVFRRFRPEYFEDCGTNVRFGSLPLRPVVGHAWLRQPFHLLNSSIDLLDCVVDLCGAREASRLWSGSIRTALRHSLHLPFDRPTECGSPAAAAHDPSFSSKCGAAAVGCSRCWAAVHLALQTDDGYKHTSALFCHTQ